MPFWNRGPWLWLLVSSGWLAGATPLAAAPPAPAPHNPNPWEEELQEDGVEVFSRPVPGSDLREFKAVKVMRAASARIFEVLNETERIPEYSPYVFSARRVGTFAGGHHEYVVSQPPILSRRDYGSRVTYLIDRETGIYQQHYELANEVAPPVAKGVERLRGLRGYWSMEPLPDGRTRVEYVLFSDPGGWIPAFTVNLGTPGTMPPQMKAIESRARDPSFELD